MASDLITCRTGEAAEITTSGTQPSTPGLREIIYDPTNDNTNVNVASLKSGSYAVHSENILTSFEGLTDYTDRFGRIITGYFKAPATGRFRFKLSCNHYCLLDMD